MPPKSKIDRTIPRRLQQPKNEEACERHVEALSLLGERAMAAVGQVIEDASCLMEARIDYIQSIGSRNKTGKRKAKYEEALAALKAACSAYNHHCKFELKDGKSATREWWSKFRVLMGAEWEPFEEIDEFIKETR